MTLRLSILICSIHSRAEMLDRLMGQLAPQLTPAVEVLADCDDGDVVTGLKRNRLTARATGEFCCFIDDDDAIDPLYCEKILDALSRNPDCVGFKSRRFLDGKQIGECSYSIANHQREDEINYAENFRCFKRTPGHLTPMRQEFFLATPFQPWCCGEDRDFERRVFPLLKSEQFIDANLYDYLKVSRENRKAEKVHPWRWKLGNARTAMRC